MLTDEEKQALLEIARAAILHAVAGGPGVEAPPGAAGYALHEPRGAFVTLHNHGKLRGCIGYVESELPLWRVVAENAVNAATRDPRFAHVQPEEIPEIDIEISALTPPARLADPTSLEIGRDGLIIELGPFRGLLLPQVATEWGFGPKEFLGAVAEKAGLPSDAWQDPRARLHRFEAEVFGEQMAAGAPPR